MIEDNLPAAALAKQISDESAYIATLAPSFSKVDSPGDLRNMTASLNIELTDLEQDLARLNELMPAEQRTDAMGALQDLKQTVGTLSSLAQARLATARDLVSRSRLTAEQLSELNTLISAQTDIARVQVTAAIADLVDAQDAARREGLDRLADVDFFAFDRHVELGAAIDTIGFHMLQVSEIDDRTRLKAIQSIVADNLDLAERRLGYFPSPAAETRARALVALLKAELEPGGGFAVMDAFLRTQDAIRQELETIPGNVEALSGFSGALLERVQTETRVLQARTVQLGRTLTFSLLVVLVVAIAASVLAWQFARRLIVERLRTVAGHISALGQESYDRAIPVTGADEIGQMESSLDALRRQAADARALRGELEDTVKQRTGEIVAEMQAHDAARNEAEASNRAKSEFLAMMSHEIRTPLNGVIGMLRLLEGDTPAGSGRNRLSTARVSAEHLLALTNDILDYSSMQDGHARAEGVHFDLRDLTGQLAGFLRIGAESKGLAFSVDLSNSAPPVLFGDVGKIRQVVINLLSNAIKYTASGEVALLIDHALNPASGRHVMTFSVTDTGIGIDPQNIDRIFDAYGRTGTPRQLEIEGMGLGLTISRRLTELIGGGLSVESEPGIGSRFSLTVELPEGDIAQVETIREEAVNDALGKHVLLVEDNKVNRMVAQGYLDRLGCTVECAETGQEALDAGTSETFDLVLLDLDLPDMSGADVAARLRDMLADAPLLVALTAHRLSGSAEELADLGVDAALEKPVSPRQLAAVLRGEYREATRSVPSFNTAQTLSGLREDIDDLGPSTTRDIVEEYLLQASESVVALRDAIDRADHANTGRIAHRLKGAASNFHLVRLTTLLAEIEATGKRGGDAGSIAGALEATCEAASADLRRAAQEAGLQLSEAKI
ncbi:ATP-binding protein [Aliiruegeria sabulilitoris]|uniref:ATP-binding protein n=1 Tax=Aliiruegeria sabulilitoris TaxID=1510458 RepID=UPI000B041B96|nr:ATP-binding protein [Aliiruegeria sabulilitoris]